MKLNKLFVSSFLFVLGAFFIDACAPQNTQESGLKASLSEKPMEDDDFHDFDMDNGGDNIATHSREVLKKFRLDLANDIGLLIKYVGDIEDKDGELLLSKEDLQEAQDILQNTEEYHYAFTEQKLMVMNDSGKKVPVDAVNNRKKKEVDINLISWLNGDWCQRSKLMIHETFGLAEIEKSLDFPKSDLLKDFLSGCLRLKDDGAYKTLANVLSFKDEASVANIKTLIFSYTSIKNITNNQLKLWFCDTNIGKKIFEDIITYECVEELRTEYYLFMSAFYPIDITSANLVRISINDKDPRSDSLYLIDPLQTNTYRNISRIESLVYKLYLNSYEEKAIFITTKLDPDVKVEIALKDEMGPDTSDVIPLTKHSFSGEYSDFFYFQHLIIPINQENSGM